MKNPIHRRIPRLLIGRAGSYFPIFLVAFVAISVCSSFFICQNSIRPLFYQQLEDGRVEDGQILMADPLQKEQLDKLESDLKINLYKNFYKEASFSLSGDDGRDGTNSKSLRIFENRQNINLAILHQGRLPERKDELAVNSSLATTNQLKPGDRLKLAGRTLELVGIVSTPDYSTVLKNAADMAMDSEHFGLGFMTPAGFEQFDDLKSHFLYSYHNQDELTEDEARDRFEAVIEQVAQQGILLSANHFYDNRCIQFVMDDMGGDVPMMLAVLVLIFISLAFMTVIQTRTLVEAESPVIGSLLASGYSRKNLIFHYSLIPTGLIALACLCGNGLAYLEGYKLYTKLYYESYCLPPFVPIFSLKSFLITSLIPLLLVILLNALVLCRYFRLGPLRFLRKDLRQKQQKKRWKLEKLPFKAAFRLRVLGDNRINIIALLFGIFIGNILLMYGLAAKTMFLNYSESARKDLKYNYTSLIKQPDPAYQDEQRAFITELDLVLKKGAKEGTEKKKITVYGPDRGSRYRARELDALGPKEIMISRGMANRYRLVIGDTVSFEQRTKKRAFDLKVAGVFEDITGTQAFLPMQHLNRLLGQDDGFFNAYLTDRPLNLTADNVITTIDREQVGNYLEHFINSFDSVFKGMLVIALLFYLVLVATVSKLILDKSRLNIAYLKIFGYRDGELSAFYLSTVAISILFFYLVSLPLFIYLLKAIVTAGTAKLDVYLEARIAPVHYLYLLLIDLGIFCLVQLWQRRKIGRLNMVAELKTING